MKKINIKEIKKFQKEINKERTPIFNSLSEKYSVFLENVFSIKNFYQKYIWRKEYLTAIIFYPETSPEIKIINKEDILFTHIERSYIIDLSKTERVGNDNMLFYFFDNSLPMLINTKGFHTDLVDSAILKKTLDIKLFREFANSQKGGVDWVKVLIMIGVIGFSIYWVITQTGMLPTGG